ncbi:MAG: DUF1840 domain-containing protein [Hydrogenophaga sp.]|uniref:DUF1840 domain-containing protein n=1 Tax=Hydrogenophaga sp. TaxID=1904254 RepID=UPI001D45110D|nr:DUF1840 domain-containing protein [Hydrogenophaga sp.]MBX3609363.1 DUF1840 domain-containing protein [Hydrogenophaga sp.]
MTVYRFKSRETGDLVMLRPHGKRLLEIIGKDPETPGVLLAEDMPRAIDAIRAAVVADEAHQKQLVEEARARGEPEPQFDSVSLRMRSAPFIEMLQRCMKEKVEVVWGV